MRPVMIATPTVQLEGDARPGAFVNCPAQCGNKRLDVGENDAAQGWFREDRNEHADVLRFHGGMISQNDITPKCGEPTETPSDFEPAVALGSARSDSVRAPKKAAEASTSRTSALSLALAGEWLRQLLINRRCTGTVTSPESSRTFVAPLAARSASAGSC